MNDNSDPAFPQHAKTGNMEGWRHGMTLRDYFAGQLVAANADAARGDTDIEILVSRAYRIADAMLKARLA